MKWPNLLLIFTLPLCAAPPLEKASNCEDKLVAKAVIDPKLSSSFFKSKSSSYPWHIVTNEDGSLEDTFDGSIDAEDLLQSELNSNCRSSHQGDHLMSFCDAKTVGDGLEMILYGGMPAYYGMLTIRLRQDQSFTCDFHAVYPNYNGLLHWKIKSKELRLKSLHTKAGQRLYGWISVEFEESDPSNLPGKSFKIEGFFNPVITSAPRAEASPSPN